MIRYEPSQITYSEYARWRMGERAVSNAQVEAVLADPDISIPPTPGSPETRRVYERTLPDGRLRIIFEPEGDGVRVINAIWMQT